MEKDVAQRNDVTQKVQELLDASPSGMDRAFRAYALNAALQADKDGTAFKNLIKQVMSKTVADRHFDLSNCPCCGGKAEFDDYDRTHAEWLVRCTVCDLNTVPGSMAKTAAQWNKRVQSTKDLTR